MAEKRSKLVTRTETEQIRTVMADTWERMGHLHPDKEVTVVVPDSPFGQFDASDVDQAACSLPYVKSVARHRSTPEVPFAGWLVTFKDQNNVKTDG